MGLNMKPALLVVDIQNVWLDGNKDLKESVEKRTDVINDAIAWFRRNKLPIVVVYHEDKEMGAVPGTNPFEFPKTIRIKGSDTKVTKRYPNAFAKTGLEATLREDGCDAVAIVGLSASGCVLGTFFGALDCDLKPYLVHGGVASHIEDHVRFAEDICDTVKVNALDQLLR
jgi:nicotinamidase-related amidase